ncbi:MAG: protein-L-isoaspartate(D-aspartate) O-methyltransferase [Pseudomonadota bacterium]
MIAKSPDGWLEQKKRRLLAKIEKDGIPAKILARMSDVPREMFVPSSLTHASWDDTALPIDAGQSISQPTVVAWMTTLLQPDARMRVLEIGTGCGYQTAILAKLFRRVYTIERHRVLFEQASKRFAELRLRNVTAKRGDGALGWRENLPFPRIIVTAAAPHLLKAWVQQLAPDGILIAPLPDAQGALRITRVSLHNGHLKSEAFMPVRFVPLISPTFEKNP